MKKLAISILLIATALTSCKNNEKEAKPNITTEVVQELETDILSTDWMQNIKLNNGAKWEANTETTDGVNKMQEALKTQTTITIDDYHQLASLLNENKNYVIKKCSMKGAPHDNLHVWLLPLIEKIDALSAVKTLENASKIKKSIEDNVNAYTTYFQ